MTNDKELYNNDNINFSKKIIEFLNWIVNKINIRNNLDILYLDHNSTLKYIYNIYSSDITIINNMNFHENNNFIKNIKLFHENNDFDIKLKLDNEYYLYNQHITIFCTNNDNNKVNLIFKKKKEIDNNPYHNIYYSINNNEIFYINTVTIEEISNLNLYYQNNLYYFDNIFYEDYSILIEIIYFYIITEDIIFLNLIKNIANIYNLDKSFKLKIKNIFNFDNKDYLKILFDFLNNLNHPLLFNKWINLLNNVKLIEILFSINSINLFNIEINNIETWIIMLLISKYNIVFSIDII